MEKSTERRDLLKNIERSIQEQWLNSSQFTAKPNDKPKFFGTFPYPYMNGVLHLGHGFTVSKLDFYCRYMRQKGYNVLFPIAWHGTGMPIVAAANKLREALETGIHLNHNSIMALSVKNQIRILYTMNVPISEIPKFVDPYYWIVYFPKIAKKDLIDFGISADFDREFITTNINQYYDSFIKWQFHVLDNANKMIKFGNKFIIFSPKDGQPCADHDRSIGEGVEVKEFICIKFKLTDDDVNLLVTTTDPISFVGIKKIFVGTNDTYTIFSRNKTKYISNAKTFRNMQFQTDDDNIKFEVIEYIKGSQLIGKTINNINIFGSEKIEIIGISDTSKLSSGIGIPNKNPKFDPQSYSEFKNNIINSDNGFIYCEPASQVISRSGDECVVCLTDQWFINYDKQELKEMVSNHIKNKMYHFDEGVKNQLLEMSNWITDWPCSRSIGLGTKLLDTNLLIDSLSDSTIYMAYYTVSHLIRKIPVEKINYDFWEYIFKDGNEPDCFTKDEIEVIRQMKNEFKYWYPLDMRVSGKDLIGNHLIMCLYNHAAIWGPEMLPKSYAINGHSMLNGNKMSKSDGNFMTLRDAIDKFGADAVRLSLAISCGTGGIDDANFTEANANEAILRLSTEIEFCKEMIDKIISNPNNDNNNNITFWDNVFENEINKCIMETTMQMDNMNFQKVVHYGFYSLLTARDNYRSMYKNKFIICNYGLMYRYIVAHIMMINPICPHYATHIWNYGREKGLFLEFNEMIWPNYHQPSNKITYLNYCIETFLNNVRTQFAKVMKMKNGDKNNLKLNVVVYSCYSEKEMNIITMYRKLMDELNDHAEIVNQIINSAEDKKDKGVYGRFANYVKVNIIRFGPEWIDLVIKESNEEYSLINEWAPIILKDIRDKFTNFDIVLKKGDNESMSKDQGPSKPFVKIDK